MRLILLILQHASSEMLRGVIEKIHVASVGVELWAHNLLVESVSH
jgi:hypothetical protein